MINGEVSILDSTTIEISELPVRTWTQVRNAEFPAGKFILSYKQQSLMASAECFGGPGRIEDLT